ncbi:sensor domain-containing protein [Mycobacterium sp. pUA109]|uniref:serine/threonine-protein kinase PknH/PknJ n=1 Tax=Mycobacterium sp. pUA109 TaxID=3238982 RepID=UPI00351BD73E
MLSVGSLIAGYRVERVLGAGGMGAVYLVANPELPRREALKLLSTELSRDEGFRARFVREADVAARLEHPNIVPIYRRGQTDDGQLWIAMQFVDGSDADEALRSGNMSPERAIHIVGEVAKALDYAHRRNVIHRDVKPANFLLSGPSGPEERVLLGDFGIARAFDDASLTGTGEVMATVSYAAPEVIAGDPLGPRADQYSLGCALFRMLTGKAPFATAGAQAAVMMAHLTKPPPRVGEQAPWLPPALDGVIATALAKDPAQRFGTCAEFVAAAQAALQPPTPDGEPTHRMASSQSPQRHTPPAYYATPGLPTQPHPHSPPIAPTQQYAPPTVQPRRRRTTILAAMAGVVVVAAGAITAIAWPSDKPKPTEAASTTTTTTTSPPPRVPATALPGLLLSADEVSSIMGVPLQGGPVGDSLVDGRQFTSVTDCVGAFTPAQVATYAGTKWTAVRTQGLDQSATPDQGGAAVIQAVVALPTPDVTNYVFMNQSNQWQDCADRPVTWRSEEWTLGRVNHVNSNMVTLTMTLRGGALSCGRALATQESILADVKVCHPGEIITQASDIAARIVAKVPE